MDVLAARIINPFCSLLSADKGVVGRARMLSEASRGNPTTTVVSPFSELLFCCLGARVVCASSERPLSVRSGINRHTSRALGTKRIRTHWG